MINLIGLTGVSRSGKDETAKILVKDFGYEQRAMAASIREILLRLNPLIQTDDGDLWSMLELYEGYDGNWDKIKAASKEATNYMIRLGQACRDVIHKDTWLTSVLPEIRDNTKIVISDCRQENEYWAIKERGGVIWKITRPSVTEKRGMDGLLDHLPWDAHIDNRGSLMDLRSMVQSVMTETSH